MAKAKSSGFVCMECGHKFRTVAAAQKAAFGAAGCPRCGGADIDMPAPEPKHVSAARLGVAEHDARTAPLTIVANSWDPTPSQPNWSRS